jgi:hypothetical protein
VASFNQYNQTPMKNRCPECGHSHGHHHQNCPEIPEIQADAEIEITCEAEDSFNQMDFLP